MVSHCPLEARFEVRVLAGQFKCYIPPFFAGGESVLRLASDESAAGGGGKIPGSSPGRAAYRNITCSRGKIDEKNVFYIFCSIHCF